jgi:hypothetical protein
MKRSYKAALLSALVFPGLGHFTLQRAARGCLFLLPTAVAAVYVARQVLARAQGIIDQVNSGALPLDPQVIADQLSAAPGAEGPLMTAAVTVCVVCWLGSVLDALWLGRNEA